MATHVQALVLQTLLLYLTLSQPREQLELPTRSQFLILRIQAFSLRQIPLLSKWQHLQVVSLIRAPQLSLHTLTSTLLLRATVWFQAAISQVRRVLLTPLL